MEKDVQQLFSSLSQDVVYCLTGFIVSFERIPDLPGVSSVGLWAYDPKSWRCSSVFMKDTPVCFSTHPRCSPQKLQTQKAKPNFPKSRGIPKNISCLLSKHQGPGRHTATVDTGCWHPATPMEAMRWRHWRPCCGVWCCCCRTFDEALRLISGIGFLWTSPDIIIGIWQLLG